MPLELGSLPYQPAWLVFHRAQDPPSLQQLLLKWRQEWHFSYGYSFPEVQVSFVVIIPFASNEMKEYRKGEERRRDTSPPIATLYTNLTPTTGLLGTYRGGNSVSTSPVRKLQLSKDDEGGRWGQPAMPSTLPAPQLVSMTFRESSSLKTGSWLRYT